MGRCQIGHGTRQAWTPKHYSAFNLLYIQNKHTIYQYSGALASWATKHTLLLWCDIVIQSCVSYSMIPLKCCTVISKVMLSIRKVISVTSALFNFTKMRPNDLHLFPAKPCIFKRLEYSSNSWLLCWCFYVHVIYIFITELMSTQFTIKIYLV